MAIEYTSHDRSLCDSVIFKIRDDAKFVDDAATKQELGTYLGRPWKFQFPPRIKSDTKSAEWEETRNVSYEPVALWKGADARTISLEAMYVVTGEKDFSGIEIARIANAAKAYFYRSIEKAVNGGKFGPVVEITSIYGAVRERSTWRMTDVSVEYADTFVNDQTAGKASENPPSFGGGIGNFVSTAVSLTAAAGRAAGGPKSPGIWPMWTKITFNLKTYTQNANEDGAPKVAIKALERSPRAKWF